MTRQKSFTQIFLILAVIAPRNITLFDYSWRELDFSWLNQEGRQRTERQGGVQKRHFQVTKTGEALDQDGIHLSFTVFEASDGTKLTVQHHEFESTLLAQGYFQKVLKKIPKVIRREKRLDA